LPCLALPCFALPCLALRCFASSCLPCLPCLAFLTLPCLAFLTLPSLPCLALLSFPLLLLLCHLYLLWLMSIIFCFFVAQRVHRHINNKDVQTLDALFDYMTPFCASPQIVNKYAGAVEIVCKKMFTMRDHREFFIREFEADSDWDNVLSASTLLPKKQKICQTSGFCEEDSFEYWREEDDGWGSDECFVCHALMEDLEVETYIGIRGLCACNCVEVNLKVY
jgi:hypothetical protein